MQEEKTQNKMQNQEVQASAMPSEDLYSLEPYPVAVSAQLRTQLVTQANEFHQQLLNHQKQNFFDNEQYYIISKRWLERWKVYVSYNEVINGNPPSKLLGCGKLPHMNEDIIDSSWRPKFQFSFKHFELNVAMKQGLQEQKDFIFADEQMWRVLKHYDGSEIIRKVVDTTQGKKVQIYLQKINAIAIFNECLKLVEREQLQKFYEINFQISRYATIEEMSQTIENKLKNSLGGTYSTRFASGADALRFWLLPLDTRKNILMNTFMAGCKANPSFSYKLFLDGEYLEMDSKVNECDILPESLLLIEIKEDREEWVFFNAKKNLQAPCNACRYIKVLKFLCSCKFAAYCSKQCKLKDKTNHKFRCPNDAESEEEEKQLKEEQDSMKGIVGLRNLGNTCFMNSGIQCLSNVPQLTNYFLSNAYEKQINKNNPLGTKGQLSTAYAKIIKSIWFGRESSCSPTQLKKAIAKFQPMFTGYNQHDSGQLVSYLLDGLHEDLNRVVQKPYVQTKDYDGREDDIVARQSWQNFLARNKSIIVDLMYGQYRSVVDCPTCNYQSIQFDPFLMCSLPIVNSNTKKIDLKFVLDHIYMTKITICYQKSWNWTMEDVLKEISKKMELSDSKKLFVYVASYASCEVIQTKRSVDEVRKQYKYRTIYVRQLFQGENTQNQVRIILSNTSCHSYYTDESYRKNLTPYRMYFLDKELTCKEIHHKLFSYYSKMIEVKDYQSEMINVEIKEQPMRILMIPQSRYSTCDYCKKKNCDGCQLPYTQDKFVSLVGQQTKVEIELYWRKNQKQIQKIFDDKEEESKSYSKKVNDGTNIYDCFKLFSQPETLAEDNAWYCPKCKEFVLAKKQMQIYKAPSILMLCLKRFKRKQYSQEKLTILVDFPLDGLDLTDYVINSKLPQQSEEVKIDGEKNKKKPILYDLIGITNHMGGTGGGHYTAYCKNKFTQQWYDFDDSYVNKLKSENDLVSDSAYILFYQRRNN